MKRGDPGGPFLTAARGGTPHRRPVWIMRQAGRYLPEYRELRRNLTFLELCNTPGAAIEATLQPVRRYGLDAAILFTDLLVPAPAMGIGLDYRPGPVLAQRVDSLAAVERLKIPDPEADLTPMLAAARGVREQLAADAALIGFVGAPFTMACYLVEGQGSKSWDGTRRLMHAEPAVFDALLDKITQCLVPLVRALVGAGCDAVQVFDSWASVLAPDEWAARCAPRSDALLHAARAAGGVAIHYVNGAAQHFDRMLASPADVLAIDWRLPMAAARARAGAARCLQGNLDPTALFAPAAELRARVGALCRAAGPRHVFNLGHGILPDTDPQALAVAIDEARQS